MTAPLSDSGDVIIVGGGLAGLLAGQLLRARGLSVIVLDKGRSVGGRLATRRIGPGLADHGAQFFTARSPEFQQRVARWQAAGLVYEWSRGWSNGSLHAAVPDGHPRYAVRGGMNALAKTLAAGQDCRLNVEVSAIRQEASQWVLTTAAQDTFRGRGLLLTPPVPQALALLHAGETTLPLDELAALQRLTYAPSLTGLFRVEGEVFLPTPGAVQRVGLPVSWIADNRQKGISPDAPVITTQASPEFSAAHWDDPDEAILAELRASFELFMSPRATIRDAQLKRWRYALPLATYPERQLAVMVEASPLVFAGDAFGGPRIEGAALSGLAAGQALADLVMARA